jgi:DNA polymerase III delta subunit
MLYVFTGSDTVRARQQAHVLLDTLPSPLRITAEDYTLSTLMSYIESVSLFGEPEPLVLDMVGTADGALEDIISAASGLAESERVFVLIEGKIPAAGARALKKYAKKYTEVEGVERKDERFNTFLLGDALLRKDKKSLWVLLARARMAGVSPEEVAGTLAWQLKAARLALLSMSAAEAGLKEFPYKKAKSARTHFKAEELEQLSTSLMSLYHEGHLGKDMEVALERFVLRL